MSLFICPVCREPLFEVDKSLKCANGHSFDKSSAGDVFLLRTSKGVHGDSREMVRARHDFLERGFYAPLRDALSRLASECVGKGRINYLDAGCGTGYYTEGVARALSDRGETSVVGIDISKDAVKISAKRLKTAELATASVYDLPIADNTIDIITNVFSPMAETEFARVMKSGSTLLYVVPASRHLYSMKSVLYESPYENEEGAVEYGGFKLVGSQPVESSAKLSGEELMSLFAMTPYFWTTSKDGAERLASLDSLEVEFSFIIYIYKRI